MGEEKRIFVLELQGSDSPSVNAMALFALPVKFGSGGTREFNLRAKNLYSVAIYIHPLWPLFH